MTEDEQVRKRGLGRGLSALLGDDMVDYENLNQMRATKVVAIEHIRPNRLQPRRRFGDVELENLTASVKDVGILQPILVRRTQEDAETFEIVAGERRWRAAQRAQLHQIPVVIKELDDEQTLKIALVENIQREDLNAIDEAEGYRRLMDEFNLTQEAISTAVGRSRSHIANSVRLLGLPDSVKSFVKDGKLSAGHARALLSVEKPEILAKSAVSKGLSVREVEALARKELAVPGKASRKVQKDADTLALEKDLSITLGLKVTVLHGYDSGGSIQIEYKNLEQLDEVCCKLRINKI